MALPPIQSRRLKARKGSPLLLLDLRPPRDPGHAPIRTTSNRLAKTEETKTAEGGLIRNLETLGNSHGIWRGGPRLLIDRVFDIAKSLTVVGGGCYLSPGVTMESPPLPAFPRILLGSTLRSGTSHVVFRRKVADAVADGPLRGQSDSCRLLGVFNDYGVLRSGRYWI